MPVEMVGREIGEDRNIRRQRAGEVGLVGGKLQHHDLAILRRVEVPALLVSALPALVNFAIILTKETVILSMITVPEIMFATGKMMAETFAFAESLLVLALFFWAFVEVISRTGRWLERRATHYLLER